MLFIGLFSSTTIKMHNYILTGKKVAPNPRYYDKLYPDFVNFCYYSYFGGGNAKTSFRFGINLSIIFLDIKSVGFVYFH